jgi:hypothetical protein
MKFNRLIVYIFLLFLCRQADAQVIQPADFREASAILYAESAIDPAGWTPKLNTYYKAKRKNETLLDSMKRVSCAYRFKSPQYRLAKSQEFTAYERKVFASILQTIECFSPDKNWKCIHHENLSLYPSHQAAIAHLKKHWGPGVDYKNLVQIGKETYFRSCND